MGPPDDKPPASVDDLDRSGELSGFGFDLPDEPWLERVRRSELPTTLGRMGPYELLAEVGRGAQGVVYRARQADTKRDIAVKRLIAGRIASEAARNRFSREIETAAALNHPNIVTVYGTDLVGDQPILAMEWIEGVPINEWALGGEPGPAGFAEKLQVFLSVCDAVHYAHQRGVLHRDLKPSNILIDADDQPHVVDFGLAKITGDGRMADVSLTHSDQFLGTPLYAAPEQARSEHGDVDVRTEVYALGAILYEVLTGRTPHTGRIHELLNAIQFIDPPAPSRLTPNLSRELDAIVMKAIAKEPARRYQSVDALAADVRRFTHKEAVLAHPPTAAYQLRKLISRHRLPFALLAVIALLVFVAGAVATSLAIRIARERGIAERRFEELRTLANSLMYDVHDAVAPLRGALAAREQIIETSMKYLDKLAVAVKDDVALQQNCAAGYFRIAEIHGDPNGEYLGQTARALESCRKGLSIVEPLLDRYPRHEGLLHVYGSGLRIKGNILAAMGRTDEALRSLEKSVAAEEQVLAADRTDPKLVLAEARVRFDMATTLERADRFKEAEALFVQIVEILDVNHPDASHDRESIRVRTNALAALGHVRVQQGKMVEAMDPLTSAIESLKLLIESTPHHANEQRSLIVARTAIGRALAATGQPDHGRIELEWAIAGHRELLKTDPHNVTTQRDLSSAHNFLGQLLDERGDYDGALREFEESIRIRRRLAADDPDSSLTQRELAVALDTAGATLRKLGRLNEALDYHLDAKVSFEQLAGSDPNNVRNQRSVAISAFFLGKLYSEVAQHKQQDFEQKDRHWHDARTHFAEALSIMQSLRAAGQLLPKEAQVIDMLFGEIEKCDQRLRQ